MNAQLVLCRGCMSYRGPVADNRPHSHHAAQRVLALDAPFRLMRPDGTQLLRQAHIAPDTVHALDSEGAPVLVLLYEAPLLQDRGVAADVRVKPPKDLVADCPRRLLTSLPTLPPVGSPPADARVARLMALARTTEGTARLADLARQAGLSPSRLTHLFTRSEGIPFKRWLLWDRLLRTVEYLAAGADLTTAAHAAGFADSAHLSRSFRAHFGIAASRIFRSRSVQVSRCPIH